VAEVIVVNGQRMKENPYFQQSILPFLTLHRDGKLQLMPRAHVVNFARVFKDAVILQHQVNNEYNYSFLEWLFMGFPVVHNHRRLAAFGYAYEENDFEAAADRIEEVVENHAKNQESYRAHGRQLLWRFSIYNPDNMAAWKELVGDKNQHNK
jgi:hypothetical protein